MVSNNIWYYFTSLMYQYTMSDGYHSLLDGSRLPLPDWVEETIDDIEIRGNLAGFDPSTIPTDYNYHNLYKATQEVIRHGPDNPVLPLLDEKALAFLNTEQDSEASSPAHAVHHFNCVLSAPPEVEVLETSHAFVAGHADPWLNQSIHLPGLPFINPGALVSVPVSGAMPQAICVGSWNGHAIWLVPNSNTVESIPGAIIVGWMKGRPIWTLPLYH
jgi:hypothetical protein